MLNSTAQTKSISRGINLAGSAPAEAAKLGRIQSIVKRTSFIVLGVYLVVLLSVVGIISFGIFINKLRIKRKKKQFIKNKYGYNSTIKP